MAILKFRIYWEEDDSVYRDILIPHTMTFYDMHLAILKCFEFDTKHEATFFKSNDHWQQGREISLAKYDKPYKAEPLIMADTTIGSTIQNPNQKFIYLYDFHKNWTFLVELISINKISGDLIGYPQCGRSEGLAPSQYGTKNLLKEKEETAEEYDLSNDSMEEGFGMEGEDDSIADSESDDL